MFCDHIHGPVTRLIRSNDRGAQSECLFALANRCESLEQRRMAVPDGRIQPVVHWETQVCLVQLDQRGLQIFASAQLLGEFIGFELMLSGLVVGDETGDLG